MPNIRHLHSRLVGAPASRVRPVLDALWSGRPGDAFPYEHIRRWRRVPEGGAGFSLGTEFGHGPFRFVVEQCDARRIRARILTDGFVGYHEFALTDEPGGTRVTHDLCATAAPMEWLVWKSLVGVAHDWAVRSCLARIDALVTGAARDELAPPLQLRAFIAWRERSARPARRVEVAS